MEKFRAETLSRGSLQRMKLTLMSWFPIFDSKGSLSVKKGQLSMCQCQLDQNSYVRTPQRDAELPDDVGTQTC